MDDRAPNSVKKPIQDLREWLARVEEIGELVRIDAPVERDEEMSAISYLLAKQKPSPAVLFNKTVGFENSKIGARHLWNVLRPERAAHRGDAGRRSRYADGRADPPHEGQAEAAHAAARGVGERGARLREHALRRRHRPRPAADPAALAARRRPLCGHRRRGDHARPRDGLPQRRHLSHDAAGQEPQAGFISRPARTRACTSRRPGSRASRWRSPPPGASIRCSCWSARRASPRTSRNMNTPAASRASRFRW